MINLQLLPASNYVHPTGRKPMRAGWKKKTSPRATARLLRGPLRGERGRHNNYADFLACSSAAEASTSAPHQLVASSVPARHPHKDSERFSPHLASRSKARQGTRVQALERAARPRVVLTSPRIKLALPRPPPPNKVSAKFPKRIVSRSPAPTPAPAPKQKQKRHRDGQGQGR